MKNPNKNNPPQPFPADPSRRTLLKGAGLAGAVAVSASSAGVVVARENQSLGNNSVPALEALETLTAAEAEVLEAICDC
ncbi:MAG: twin-arginine translocation signal domain-containing protein, partial [Pseudomonadota bacterium]|nr:twin-arginine translocation signal domain-containing protein [Pseudomonadota bacterium]